MRDSQQKPQRLKPPHYGSSYAGLEGLLHPAEESGCLEPKRLKGCSTPGSSKRLGLMLFIFTLSFLANAQTPQSPTGAPTPTPTPTPQPAQEVPVIDGGAGPCSIEFTVIDANAKPQYAASVKVHIRYGFAGVKKLDLEAGTNVNGKVKFKGLPVKVHRPPLEFNASKDELTGMATYNPATECQALQEIILEKPKAASSN